MHRQFSSARPRLFTVSIAASLLLVLVCYAWFISYGRWTNWPTRTTYYDQLATAFQHHHLALELQPDPLLLALTNPYNPAKRGDSKYLLDVSLYAGKYYLYFGPVPALMLIPLKMAGAGVLGDELLVFAMTVGVFLAQSALIVSLWKHFFRAVPAWLVPLCLLCAGLVSPWAWMLTDARVYEAAGAGAQFFFLLGLWMILTALVTSPRSLGWFAGAGLAWALALGSRLTQIFPVASFCLLIAIFFLMEYRRTREFASCALPVISLALPLMLGVGLLGWYNQARFGSPFETGFSYQLTLGYMQKHLHELFSPVYILPNLYDYLLATPGRQPGFPFLRILQGSGLTLFPFLRLPEIYNTGSLLGLLCSTPFILFAGLPVAALGFKKTAPQTEAARELNWFTVGLLAASLAGLASLVAFFFSAMRYTADILPPLMLLAILGFWQGERLLAPQPGFRRLYLAAGIGLMLFSITISTLAVFSIRAEDFQALNPTLWTQLTQIFPW
jgi:hypothetical protein